MVVPLSWDDYPCKMAGICMVLIKMFDEMVGELTKVRYVSQLKRNLTSIGALKVLSLEVSVRDGALKMIRGSMVVLKGV